MLERTKNITFLGLMFALMLILFLIPIPVLTVEIALALIPIYVIAQIKGIKMGIIAGLAFGLLSLIISLTVSVSILRFAFQNPLVSVLPRICVGFVAAAVYKGCNLLFKKLNKTINTTLSSYIAALLATITNTVLVLGSLILIYNGKVLDSTTNVTINFQWILLVVVSVNTLVEIIVLPLVTAPIVAALNKVMNVNKTSSTNENPVNNISDTE